MLAQAASTLKQVIRPSASGVSPDPVAGTERASSASGDPAKRTATVNEVLASRTMRGVLYEYCEAEHSAENLRFLGLCDKLSWMPPTQLSDLRHIVQSYVAQDRDKTINISEALRKGIMTAYDGGDLDAVLEGLNLAIEEIVKVVNQDSFKRFIQSPDTVLKGQKKFELLDRIQSATAAFKNQLVERDHNPDAEQPHPWPKRFAKGSSSSSSSSSSGVSSSSSSGAQEQSFGDACQDFLDETDLGVKEQILMTRIEPQMDAQPRSNINAQAQVRAALAEPDDATRALAIAELTGAVALLQAAAAPAEQE